jgi:hypothetical protein
MAAHLNSPFGVHVDIAGNLFISDAGNQRIRMINPSAIINTVGGFGLTGYGGDDGPATQALLDTPIGMVTDLNQAVLVADMNNHRIRVIGDVAAPPPPTPTPTPTNTRTPTPTPTITLTPTPVCPDADGDTLNDCAELTIGTDPGDADTDDDGCNDFREIGPGAELGGQRDPLYYWDFYDTPDAANVRDRVVNLAGDLLRVAQRFGSSGSPAGDPLSFPPPAPAYHTAFDRGARIGPNPWDVAPADGTVNVSNDILGIAAQFGHTCS